MTFEPSTEGEMNPSAEILLEQIRAAGSVGRQILDASDLRDLETTWRFEERQS